MIKKQVMAKYIDSTKNHVETVINFIDKERKQRLNILKRFTKDRSLRVYYIIDSVYKKYNGKLPHEKIKNIVRKKIKEFVKRNRDSYAFIVNTKGRCVLCTTLPALEDNNIIYIQDRYGKYVVKEEIEKAKNGGGFVNCRWYSPKRSFSTERLSYVKLFKPYGWVVGSGYYVDKFSQTIKNDIRDILRNYRYGDSMHNYIFISRLININGGDCYALGILSPNVTKEYEGKCISSNVKDIKGKYFRRDALRQLRKKGWALVKYYYKIPDSNKYGKKIAYIKLYKPWNWIVGSGFYVKDAEFAMQKTLESVDMIAQKLKYKAGRYVLAVSIFVVLVVFTLYVFTKRILEGYANKFKHSVHNKTMIDKDSICIKEMSDVIEYGNSIIDLVKTQEEKLNEFNKTLQKRIDEATKKLREKDAVIFERSKYAQMGEMMSMIAHQWRQPLNAVSSAVVNIQMKAMLGENVGTEEIEKCASFVQNRNRDLSNTINDFMTFFRKSDTPLRFNVKEAVEKSVKMLDYVFSLNNIELLLDIGDGIVIVGYPQELVHIMINLINNAKDAIRENDIEKGKITIKAKQKDNFCIISVKDNAGGIDESILDKVFELYFTTKENSKGTGIGLYMAKMSIEKNFNGSIKAFNEDCGAVFEISIPIE